MTFMIMLDHSKIPKRLVESFNIFSCVLQAYHASPGFSKTRQAHRYQWHWWVAVI